MTQADSGQSHVVRRNLSTVLLICIALLAWSARVLPRWPEAVGYEYEWVAWSWASGHGYSFDPGSAWLGPYAGGLDYSPTAWVEPVHTGIMAASFRVFGEHGRLILVLLNYLWLGATCALIVLLVQRLFSWQAGVAAAILFALMQSRASILLHIGNSAMASFLISLCALLMLMCLEYKSLARSSALGAAVGLATLTHAASLLFVPLAVVAIFARWGITKKATWGSAGLVAMTALFVVSPWTLRNYLTFGELVTVRNGFGLQLHIGNPALAHTVLPGLKVEGQDMDPPWTAPDLRQATVFVQDITSNRALRDYSIHVIEALEGEAYWLYNEAQRDRAFLERSLAFMGDYPLLSATMLFWKAAVFFALLGPFSGVISALACVGWFMLMRDLRASALAVLIMGYSLIYAISMPLYDRYRGPIEPIMFVLIGLVLGTSVRRLRHWSNKGSIRTQPTLRGQVKFVRRQRA